MQREEYFRPDTPTVIHEIIDGEAVMIHMEKGYYYSLDQTGSAIWKMLDAGTAVSEIIAITQQQYAGTAGEIEEDVYQFLQRLEAEELIIPGKAPAGEQAAAAAPHPAMNGTGDQEKKAFNAPELHKYTDMEDLLLLDPIHEVDDTGWPALPDDG